MNFLYETKTNLVYQISAFKSSGLQLDSSNREIWILGERFKFHPEDKESNSKAQRNLQQLLNSIAWFSYTKNFDPIPSQNPEITITTDAGWGCMIRAGQMLLFTLLLKIFRQEREKDESGAESLKYFLLKAYFREKLKKEEKRNWIFGMGRANEKNQDKNPPRPLLENSALEENLSDQLVQSQVTRPLNFSDMPSPGEILDEKKDKLAKSKSLDQTDSRFGEANELGLFSLQRFAVKALELFQKPLANWFRPTTFLLILKQLIKTNAEFKGIVVHNIVENIFYLKSLYKKAFCAGPEELSSIATNEQCIDLLCKRPWKQKVVLSMTTLLGIERTDPLYQPLLSRLMEVSSFCGMLGGYNQSAYYFVGKKTQSDFYFLDPHYVKQSIADFDDTKRLEKQFFDKTFLEINYANMCSSVSVVFFLKGNDDFAELMGVLKALEELYKDDFFLAYFLDKIVDEDLANDIVSF